MLDSGRWSAVSHAAARNAIVIDTTSLTARAPSRYRHPERLSTESDWHPHVFDQVIHHHHCATRFEAKVHSREALSLHHRGDAILIFGLTEQKHEPAAACTRDLPSR